MSGRRPRHKDGDYEALLKQAEKDGWRVTKGKKHFRALCPHPCGCRVTVASTPRHSGTISKVRADFNRCGKGR